MQQQSPQQQQQQQQYRFHLIEGNPADRRKRKRTSSLATVLTISEDIGSGFDDDTSHHHVLSSDMEMTQRLRFTGDESNNNTSSHSTPSRRWYMYQPVKRRNSITTSSERERQEEEGAVTENRALSSISSPASALYHHHQTTHVSITDSSTITATTIHTRNSHNEQPPERTLSSNPSTMGDEGNVHYHPFGVNPPPPNTTAGDPACSRNRTNSLPPYPLHSRCNSRSNIIVSTDHRIQQQAVEQAQENLSHRSRQRLNPSSRTTSLDTIGILPTEESELVVEETAGVLLSPNSAELERKKKALKRISIANLLN